VSDRGTPPSRGTDGRGIPAVERARLAAELHEELARTRLAWAAATLRGDAARRTGDRAAAARALDEQRTLLRDLHASVDTAVGRALVEREAATIVAAAAASSSAERAPAAALRSLPSRSRRGGVGAVLGAVVALVAVVAGSVAVGSEVPTPTPTVAPVAGEEPVERVTVAGDRVQPLDAALARLSTVLGELGARLREVPASLPAEQGASATSDREHGASGPPPSPGTPGRHEPSDPSDADGVVVRPQGDEPEPTEEDRDVRVDAPTRTDTPTGADAVEDVLGDPLGSVPGDDEVLAPNARLELELPIAPDDEGGHLSFRSATG
jgi:hypothetical protein